MTTATDWTPAQLAALATSSLATIQSLQHESGAYPASPTFSAYRGYSWFRDGAFIADGVSAGGGVESAGRFFDWCTRILVERRAQVEEIVVAAEAGTPVADERMLATRFTLDGEAGDDDWWDFQLDGYGTWLWAAVAHGARHDIPLDRWREGFELSVDYLVSSWQRPCFDWWEENPERVHVATLGCIAAGLTAVVDAGVLDAARTAAAAAASEQIHSLIRASGTADGHLVKWLGATEVDASLLALLAPLSVFPPTEALGARTLEVIERQLSVDGGVHRYLADTFYGGGQWPLLSCMLGLAEAAAGDRAAALAELRWAAATALPDGTMPEQVDTHLLAPHRRAEWVERWGTVATPLLWTHAMYLRLAVELGVVE